jgi:hypothetical protein
MPTPNQPNGEAAPEGALDLFLAAFGRVNLALGGGLSVVAAILVWHFVPAYPVPLWLVALVGLPLGMTLTSFALALRHAVFLVHQKPTTSIVDTVEPYAPYSPCIGILIVRWSSSAALPVGSNVTISIAEQYHERPIGIGTVRSVQVNGNAVITLDFSYGGTSHYTDSLFDGNKKGELIPKVRIGSQVSFQNLPPAMPPATPPPSTIVSAAPISANPSAAPPATPQVAPTK